MKVLGIGNDSSTSSDNDDEMNERDESVNPFEEEEKEGYIDYRKKVMQGSFLPAMALLERKVINVEAPID